MTELPRAIWVETVEGHTVLIKMKVEIITSWRLISHVNSRESKHLARVVSGGLPGSTGTTCTVGVSDRGAQGPPVVIREAQVQPNFL